MQHTHSKRFYWGTDTERLALTLPTDAIGTTWLDTDTTAYYVWTGSIWITTSGSAVSVTATQVAFGSATNTVTSSPNYTYTDSISELLLAGQNAGTYQGRSRLGIGYGALTLYGQTPIFYGYLSGGTLASPAAVATDAILMQFGGGGRTDTGWSGTVGVLNIVADGNFTSTSAPTRLELQITAVGSTTPRTAVTISNSGLKNNLTNTYATLNYTLTLTGNASIIGTNTGDQTIPVVPVNTSATTHQFFTAYNSSTGAFTKAQPVWADVDKTVSSLADITTRAHSALSGLDYANAGHTGFQPAGSYLTSVTPHNILSATHGDTTAASVARGDLITGQGATATWARLGKGAAGTILRSDGTDVAWASLATAGIQPLATNLTSLAGLTYASAAYVKMTAAGTFTLDTSGPVTGSGAAISGYNTYLPLWSSASSLTYNQYLYLYQNAGNFLRIQADTDANGAGIALGYQTDDNRAGFLYYGPSATGTTLGLPNANVASLYANYGVLSIATFANQPVVFGVNGAEVARLTSAGLGIKTTPLGPLHILLPDYGSTDVYNTYAVFGASNGFGVKIGYNATTNLGVIFAMQPGIAFGSLCIGYPSATGMKLGLNRTPSYYLHVGFDTNTGNGAYVTNAGVWTNGSSHTFKTDFQDIDKADLLNRVMQLDIKNYRYKNSKERGISPFSEDFHEQFGLGGDPKYLAAGHSAGVALVAIQQLKIEIDVLKMQIEALKN